MFSDFQPKGAVADCYGAYLAGPGITDRATVLIDSGGTVRHASSVGPAGERDIAEVAALCEAVDAKGATSTQASPTPQGLGTDPVLFVKNACGLSRRVRVAVDNLHASSLSIRNASDDSKALAVLRELSGAETAPCLSIDGKPIGEGDVIVRTLAERLAPIC